MNATPPRLGLIDELNEHRRGRLTLINLPTIEPVRLLLMLAIEKSAQSTDHAAVAGANALRLHAHYRGKTIPKVPLSAANELAISYTPGVAEPCRAIVADLEAAFSYTNRGNTVAILSDGSRVLALGDIGPQAGLPVMEGKALLFKLFGDVDAIPLCIRAREAEDIVRTVELIEPSFGGTNLEDIAQPKCFGVLDEARRRVLIPVWRRSDVPVANGVFCVPPFTCGCREPERHSR